MAPRTFIRRRKRKRKTIGFLGATTRSIWDPFVKEFEEQLRKLGWIKGANIAIHYGWAKGQQKEYAKWAKRFVRRDVDVIVTSGTSAALAAKKATKKIPIVFASAGAPQLTGLIACPNVTGLSNEQPNLVGRRLRELKKVVPGLKRLAVVGHRGNRVVRLEMAQIRRRARGLGINASICGIKESDPIGPAIRRVCDKADALYVCSSPLLATHRAAIINAAAKARLSSIYTFEDYVNAGGLMSYGPDFRAMFSRAARLVDKILRETKPADIPVKLQKKCELVVNRNTAHALGLPIPKGAKVIP